MLLYVEEVGSFVRRGARLVLYVLGNFVRGGRRRGGM